ncbi:MAG: DUF1189 family protein [Rickettsiales bacterium]
MNIIRLFLGSFYSADTYRAVRTRGGFHMGYALLVVLACTLVVTIYFTAFVHRELFTSRDGKPIVFDNVVQQIAGQVPTMTWQNNSLKSSVPGPTVISISSQAFEASYEEFPIITIDTSGQTTRETMKTPVLITDTELMMKDKKETKIQSLSDMVKDSASTLIINRSLIDDSAKRLIEWTHRSLGTIYFILGGVSWFVFATYLFIVRIFMLLALGLAGLLIGSMTKTKLGYEQAVGLAAVSYTPVAILDTILFAGAGYPAGTLTLFLAGVVALFAAIHCSNPPAAVPIV